MLVFWLPLLVRRSLAVKKTNRPEFLMGEQTVSSESIRGKKVEIKEDFRYDGLGIGVYFPSPKCCWGINAEPSNLT